MKEIYFVTSSKRKVISLQSTFSKFMINVKQVDIELPEIQSLDVEEVAIEKVKYAFKRIRKHCVVQDSGFYIDSLNGFPGALVKFILSTIDIEGVLKLTEGKLKTCEFRECLSYMDKDLKQPICFTHSVKGTISESILGEVNNNGSRLYQIFIPENTNKTIAQMSVEEHRIWNERTSHKNEVDLANYLNKNLQ
jgi:XTP/dITP diphosphohydrolase